MIQKANVSHGSGKDGQGGEKEDVTPFSLFKVVVESSSRLLCHANVNGKKNVMKKERKGRVRGPLLYAPIYDGGESHQADIKRPICSLA